MSASSDTNPDHGRPPAAETRRLAEHVAGLDVDALPAEVVDRAIQVIADSLACGIAGVTASLGIVEPTVRYARAVGGGVEDATLIATGERVSQPAAALANAVTMHTIDYDDTHMASVGHFGASVTAAALAAVERSGGTGRDLIAAVVGGFDAGGKVGRWVLPGHYQRWHSTASLGGIAAAAAAARGMRLDPAGTDMAISFAADDAGGTRYCIKVGDYSKSLHAGTGAWKGSQGALLASLGALGPTGLLEHPVGFYWAYSDEREPGRLASEIAMLGTRWEILEDDIKAHPCLLSGHTAIELAIDLTDGDGPGPDDIKEIRIAQPPYSDHHGMNLEPDTAMAARLSIPFCIAAAILDREVGMAQYENDRFLDPEIRRLMRLVKLEPDADLAERYPDGCPTIMHIETHDGVVHSGEIGYQLGSHKRPMSAEQHRAKLRALTTRTLDEHAAEALLSRLGDLASLRSVDGITAGLAEQLSRVVDGCLTKFRRRPSRLSCSGARRGPGSRP